MGRQDQRVVRRDIRAVGRAAHRFVETTTAGPGRVGAGQDTARGNHARRASPGDIERRGRVPAVRGRSRRPKAAARRASRRRGGRDEATRVEKRSRRAAPFAADADPALERAPLLVWVESVDADEGVRERRRGQGLSPFQFAGPTVRGRRRRARRDAFELREGGRRRARIGFGRRHGVLQGGEHRGGAARDVRSVRAVGRRGRAAARVCPGRRSG
mmetsp:Transcript_9097/g.37168  ORF Transcript_9097/g.37168 Transcript_9097/m.37168 type:complete len:215 (-) Transcript_9097:216-860(-)